MSIGIGHSLFCECEECIEDFFGEVEDRAAMTNKNQSINDAQTVRMNGGDWATLLSLRDVMKSAYTKGGDRLMSVWERDLNAIEAAIEILGKAAQPPAAPVETSATLQEVVQVVCEYDGGKCDCPPDGQCCSEDTKIGRALLSKFDVRKPHSRLSAGNASESLRQLFEDHYWDSFQGDKEIVMKHVDSVLGLWAASPRSTINPTREQVAQSIYDVANRWIAPNFPKGHKLRTFDEIDGQDLALHLDYADAVLALFSHLPQGAPERKWTGPGHLEETGYIDKQERCPTCGRTDYEEAHVRMRCRDPWHADAHLRAKSPTLGPTNDR